ncbi:uncharacterized protein LOC134183037 isoform X2 [Corticium candelabrum]|uniref:uncharacterized protein LOC134183037 isoform X2 n=1 Tax=Corticium candelabrum TaxID=121492 RepID=UPI002E26FE8D|nr:uncharacterized protein LOC134183037 isoform X2 [Corticium candelabrum]
MKSSVEETNRRNSLIVGISFARKHLLNLSAKLNILFAGCILTLHSVFLMWGSVLLWHNYGVWSMILLVAALDVMLLARMCRPGKSVGRYHPMVIYMGVAIIASWLILVGMYIDPPTTESEEKFLNVTANLSDEELSRQLLVIRTRDAKESLATIQDSIGNIGISINVTLDIQFETIAYVGIQFITPVIIFTRWMMPRVDLTNKELSQLLMTGVAMSFDIVELQDNIQNEDLRSNKTLAYLILLFTSLSLLQLLQLSEALAKRAVSSTRWEMFWTIYSIVCQEIPFLVTRIYILSVSGFAIVQLIFPLKNAYSIVFGFYHIFAVLKIRKGKLKIEERQQKLSATMLMDTSDGMSGSFLFKITDTISSVAQSIVEKKSLYLSWSKIFVSFILPVLILIVHLLVLIWRVTLVNKNGVFWLLALSVLPFAAITIPRIIQYRQGIAKEKMKVNIWYQPLLIYLIVAITCFWLIILPLADNDKFLSNDVIISRNGLTTACDLTKVDTDRNRSKLLSSIATVLPSPTAEPYSHPVTFFAVPSPTPIERAENAVETNTTGLSANQTATSTSITAIPTHTRTISTSTTAIPTYTTAISISTTATFNDTRTISKGTTTTPNNTAISINKTFTSAKFTGFVNCERDASDPQLADTVSYALLQLVLPLTILGRWWMPKEGLTSKAFSSLLQVALAMAFDIAEFTHLVVEEPQLHKDQTLLILVLTFTSTSIFLLVQIDVGMTSDNTVSEIVWTTLTVLFLDGPFFVLRVYIASEYSTEDLQLVFLLKNLFGIIFGSYRVISLCSSKSEESEDDEINASNRPRLLEVHKLNDDIHVYRSATDTENGSKETTEIDLNDNSSVPNSQTSHDEEVDIPNVAAPLHDGGVVVISNEAAISDKQTSSYTHSNVQKAQEYVTNNEGAHDQQNGDNSNASERYNHFELLEERKENGKHRFAHDMEHTVDNDKETSSLSARHEQCLEKSHSNDENKIKSTDGDNVEIIHPEDVATASDDHISSHSSVQRNITNNEDTRDKENEDGGNDSKTGSHFEFMQGYASKRQAQMCT